MLNSKHIIDATFVHEQGYKFNIRYASKGRFAAALRKSTHCHFDNAVDYAEMCVIKPDNLKEYLGNANKKTFHSNGKSH